VPHFEHGPPQDVEALLQRDEFCHRHCCQPFGGDWRLGPQHAARLWILGLHEHGWAVDLARAVEAGSPHGEAALDFLVRKLTDWIRRCDIAEAGSRELAWNGYAIATRVGAWARVYRRLHGRGWKAWDALEPAFLRSFWRQAEFLHQHVEWDLRGNHLIRDAVGLAWAGRFFEGKQPRRWLQAATALAVQQAQEQVLADGGHFERSPMYHLHVMEDLLTLALLLEDRTASTLLRQAWAQMAEAARWMCHPDGRIALLNDSAFNGASEPRTLLKLGQQLLGVGVDAAPPRGGRFLPDFGLATWHGDPWTVFFDVGPVGVDYQPGHAHADTLAIEASYRGQRLFVDPGTYGYDHDFRRRYDRSTDAHNTVCIAETDSSEVWHIFRTGRRARPKQVDVRIGAEVLSASASHDGYDHLPGRPKHHRAMLIENNDTLLLRDRIEGLGRMQVSGGLLLAPGWTAQPQGEGWRVARDGLSLDVAVRGKGLSLRTEQRAYHPEYGLEETVQRLCWNSVIAPVQTEVLVVPA
jgi:uncharacterized heparinase superfamily protein